MEEDRSKVPETVSGNNPESLASNDSEDHAVRTSSHNPTAIGEETEETTQRGEMERDALEDRAVRFLLNASVSGLDLSQKLYFLESKGFTSTQIQSILHQLRTVQSGHLEETFQKAFGGSSIAPAKPTQMYENGMKFVSPIYHHQKVEQSQNVNGGSNIAIIGLISGIATMVGMAGWRWLNGGDFELIPPPRIISTIMEQQNRSEANDTNHNVESDSVESKANEADRDDDYFGMNFYSNETNSVNARNKKEEEEEEAQEKEKRIKSKALTNSAMDYLLRRTKNTHGVENDDSQWTVQDQLVSMEEKLSNILDSVKSKDFSHDADREKSEHETIEKLEQIKMLLSTINNLTCKDDNYMGIQQPCKDVQEKMSEQTHNSAIHQALENDPNMITVDLQDEKPMDHVQGKLSSCSMMPSNDLSSTDICTQSETEHVRSNPTLTSNDTNHVTPYDDASTPQCPTTKEETVLSNPPVMSNDTNHTSLHDASTSSNPMVSLSYCKDDAIFVECLLRLLQQNIQSVPDLVTTLSTIQMYCNNILKYKDTHSSSKYCKIHTNNPIFKKYIQQTKGAVELLESIGFRKESWESNSNETSNALKWTIPSRWIVDGVDSCDGEQSIPIPDSLSALKNVSEELNYVKQQISARKSQEEVG